AHRDVADVRTLVAPAHLRSDVDAARHDLEGLRLERLGLDRERHVLRRDVEPGARAARARRVAHEPAPAAAQRAAVAAAVRADGRGARAAAAPEALSVGTCA